MTDNILAPGALLKAQKLADLTDTKIRIPILGIRLGLDFIIGLIPIIGDIIMVGVALRIVHLAKKMDVPADLRALMYRHILLDFVFGLIPVVGDVIDLFYKSNQKNVRIIEKWWVSQNHQKILAHSQQKLKEWQSTNSYFDEES
ncbi:DUF4112 domain-containing protein [Paraglaciecola aquimarina]|uniref:DUF4112 domain-containing protein n=1 Tax=Paraglaciecola algarum TaxID=3050085 RepID=A0ABS9D7U8_9ALTE|nr:DUF4112 domain-containing protein [Paraglaciecola sp. G1-23]MCF2949021.1 DUF4112 domain-containing protein [Paraglaciecola sp. G1-23]